MRRGALSRTTLASRPRAWGDRLWRWRANQRPRWRVGEARTATGHQLWTALEIELERARRYERTFAVSAVSGNAHDLRYLAAATRDELRAIDAAAIIEGRLLVLWAEADRDAGELAVKRLCDGRDVRHTTVAFPVDGLSATALIDRLADEVVGGEVRYRSTGFEFERSRSVGDRDGTGSADAR